MGGFGGIIVLGWIVEENMASIGEVCSPGGLTG